LDNSERSIVDDRSAKSVQNEANKKEITDCVVERSGERLGRVEEFVREFVVQELLLCGESLVVREEMSHKGDRIEARFEARLVACSPRDANELVVLNNVDDFANVSLPKDELVYLNAHGVLLEGEKIEK
jgi:hypothetical protein